ncbi:hypothetical protein [Terriglobus saanensis]|uniref:Uncharacterized protein n=1 Tax=Terriglobus saanensis (strain ATCC BAA-1853 / DSM 23119 / SP1PR4) TaxID=401053 RepID=E8V6C9_TERSS|nr:hypothetical protein [Terriglobus saanensis]ADV81594.1 hypothetical protein AciPR4_0761 [Terriglobus saanensis SP1PR4]
MSPIALQGFSYRESSVLLYSLVSAISRSGGWVLEKKALAGRGIALRVEVQSRDMLDLYAALLAAGLELTRWSHLALAERCTCRQHLTSPENQRQVIPLCLNISFLNDTSMRRRPEIAS